MNQRLEASKLIDRYDDPFCLENYEDRFDLVQTVEVTLQYQDYKAIFNYKTTGNCRGFDIMDSAAYDVIDQLTPDPDEDDFDSINICLWNEQVKMIQLEDLGEDDIERMITSVRIIKAEYEK